ncbi:MAG: hypothetical protein MUO72_00760 [Bacteroidales bacterium]|nr:hypothetical protein [Bacteroidales bacterium]
MKAFAGFVSFTLLFLFCIHLNSCDRGRDYYQFLIKVDSIQVPKTITSGIPFDITFFGTIGGNGCYSFSNFNQTLTDNEIMIEAWGKVDAKAFVCPTVMVYLNGHKATVTIQTPGTYILKIKQPGNKYLERQITIN